MFVMPVFEECHLIGYFGPLYKQVGIVSQSYAERGYFVIADLRGIWLCQLHPEGNAVDLLGVLRTALLVRSSKGGIRPI